MRDTPLNFSERESGPEAAVPAVAEPRQGASDSGASYGAGLLDALVMVARAHGVDASVDAVRRRFQVGEGPLGDAALIALAGEMGLRAQALRVGWKDLPRFSKVLPAILRLRDGAALVLDKVTDDPHVGRVAVLRDPSLGPESRAVVGEEQLGAVWDGELILVKRRFGLADEAQPFGLAWIVGQVLRERGTLRDIAIASLIGTVFAIVPPFIAMIVLDRVIVNQSVSTLEVLAGALALIILFDALLGYLRRKFMEVAATRIDRRHCRIILPRARPPGIVEAQAANLDLSAGTVDIRLEWLHSTHVGFDHLVRC